MAVCLMSRITTPHSSESGNCSRAQPSPQDVTPGQRATPYGSPRQQGRSGISAVFPKWAATFMAFSSSICNGIDTDITWIVASGSPLKSNQTPSSKDRRANMPRNVFTFTETDLDQLIEIAKGIGKAQLQLTQAEDKDPGSAITPSM